REPAGEGQRLSVSKAGAVVGTFELPVGGAHNARNALAAIAVADVVGVPFEATARALSAFQGVQRRFQTRGIAGGVTVFDDYAHHPTEVRATLEAARERTPRRILAIFQPHLYSRTQYFGRALGQALAAADMVVVTDVYGAREDPLPGVTGKLVVDGVIETAPRKRVAYLPKRGDIASYVAERSVSGDAVITIGAGDVTMLGDEILAAISARGAR
ncbi:MAG TPA: cyanophycin synthetase, partial [Actinomycetota bacterium]|nr:cyanophycin synthetase [Actinomycetota bacterium]